MCTYLIRQYLDSDIRVFGHRNNSVQLFPHDGLSANRSVHDCLIEHYLNQWRIRSSEELLPCGPLLDSFLDDWIGKPRYPDLVHCPGIFAYLEDSWHDCRVVDLHRSRRLLQTNKGRIRQRKSLPPTGLFALARKLHEPFTLIGITHAVEIAEIPDIAQRRTPLTRFHAAYLRRGAQQALGYLVHRQSQLETARSEHRTEFASAECGTAHFRHWRSLPSASAWTPWVEPQIPIVGQGR